MSLRWSNCPFVCVSHIRSVLSPDQESNRPLANTIVPLTHSVWPLRIAKHLTF